MAGPNGPATMNKGHGAPCPYPGMAPPLEPNTYRETAETIMGYRLPATGFP